jgi:hypothetical protein
VHDLDAGSPGMGAADSGPVTELSDCSLFVKFLLAAPR